MLNVADEWDRKCLTCRQGISFSGFDSSRGVEGSRLFSLKERSDLRTVLWVNTDLIGVKCIDLLANCTPDISRIRLVLEINLYRCCLYSVCLKLEILVDCRCGHAWAERGTFVCFVLQKRVSVECSHLSLIRTAVRARACVRACVVRVMLSYAPRESPWRRGARYRYVIWKLYGGSHELNNAQAHDLFVILRTANQRQS